MSESLFAASPGDHGTTQQHVPLMQAEEELGQSFPAPQPDERDPEVELVLSESDYTTKMWPHKFKVVYTITLHGEQLKTDFR